MMEGTTESPKIKTRYSEYMAIHPDKPGLIDGRSASRLQTQPKLSAINRAA
jgi:hypothetical protein